MGFSFKGAVSSAGKSLTSPQGIAAGLFGGVGGAASYAGLQSLYGGGLLQTAEQQRQKAVEMVPEMAKPGEYKYTSFLQPGATEMPDYLRLDSMLNTQALEKLRGEALQAPGESAWLKLATQQQQLEQKQALDQARAQTLQGVGMGQRQLAMRGGLRSGAAERLAQSGARGLMQAQQQVGAAGQLARAGLGTQAEQYRLATLQAMPGLETQAAQAQEGVKQFNIQNMLNELKAQEAAKALNYQQQMQAWAANQQARAIASSAPTQGVLGQLTGNIFGGIL